MAKKPKPQQEFPGFRPDAIKDIDGGARRP